MRACQRVSAGVVVEPGLRSQVEDRWRAAYQKAGSGSLDALRKADAKLVAEDAERLAGALHRILDSLSEDGRALVVGHSPTNEAAVLGRSNVIATLLPCSSFYGDDSYAPARTLVAAGAPIALAMPRAPAGVSTKTLAPVTPST